MDIFFGDDNDDNYDNAMRVLLQQEYERKSLNLQKAFVEHKLSMYKEKQNISTQYELNRIIIKKRSLHPTKDKT